MKLAEAVMQLERAIHGDRLAQAYIVEGSPRTVGTPFAEQVLKALYCEVGGACGECAACRRVMLRTHPDVLWVEPQKKSRQIGIDDVRALQHRIFQTAYLQGWKCCILVGAERMNISAANAFLKTLEEPPAKTLFLLLTESPGDLLPTIASRCQTIMIEGGLEEEGVWDAELLALLAEEGGAAPGGGSGVGPLTQALARSTRMQALLTRVKEAAEKEVDALGDSEALSEDAWNARVGSRYREIRSRLMKTMLLWYRDVLLIRLGMDEALLHYPERGMAARAQGAVYSERGLLRCLRIVESMQERLERNMQDNVVFGAGFGAMAQLVEGAVRKPV